MVFLLRSSQKWIYNNFVKSFYYNLIEKNTKIVILKLIYN